MLAKEIYFLVWTTTSLISALTLMFVYLIIKKWLEIKKEQKINNYMKKINDHVFAFLYETDRSRFFLPDSKVKYTAIERILTELSAVISGEGKERIAILANDLFTERYRVILQSSRWSKRMNVLFKIDSLGISTLNEELKALLKAEHITKEEKLNIFRCLANTKDHEVLTLLQNTGISLSILECRSVLNRMDEDLFAKTGESFKKYSMNLKLAMIDMIGIRKKLEFVPFLERLLVNVNSELRIRAMKAIGEIGFLSDYSSLEHFASSPQWEERLMAAKVIGKTKLREGLAMLNELIKDTSWNVRSQAAKAYLNYPEGLDSLNHIRRTSDDPYARDMAMEWSERGVEHAANDK